MSNRVNSVGIIGIASCLPNKVLSNSDLEKMVDTSDEWITKRTGIFERRILEKDRPAYELGVEAARKAIDNAGITPKDIGLIIVATETPDYLAPSTACIIQNKLGAVGAAAFDLNAACSGFIYGITVAKQFIETGYNRYVLVVACEGLTKVVDWEDRNTCVLFGDGAGAVVLGPVEEGYGIIAANLGADGSLGHNITIPCCHLDQSEIEKRKHENKRVIWMDGSEVFKFAVRVMAEATEKVVNDAGFSLNDVKLVVPHQANIRIIDGATKRLDIPEDKVYKNVHKYGNISSASIPVALDEAINFRLISKGDYLVLVGFGGGLTWGSVLMRWVK